jgi:hypothetical protein
MVSNSYLKSLLIKSLSVKFLIISLALSFGASAQSIPTAPSGLTKNVYSTHVVISWDANPADQNVSGYLTGTYISVMGDVGTPTASTSRTINYAAIGVGPGDRFYLAVRAVNANGLSGISNIMITVPWPADTEAPTEPTLSNSTPTETAVVINWSSSTDNVGVTGYNIYTYISASGGSPTYTSTSNSRVINFSDLGLTAGQSFKVVVKAKDAAGNFSASSNEVTITIPNPTPVGDTEAPTAPTLTNNTPTATDVVLNWSGSTDNVGVSQYKVYTFISTPGGATYTTVNTTQNINFIYLGVLPGQTFKVIVKALDAAGNISSASNEVTITAPTPADTQAPTAPTLTNTTPTATDVVLNWSGSTDNVGVTQYKVYTFISTPGGATYTTLNTTQNINFIYLGVLPGQTFKVIVKALDAAGNISSASNEVTITAPTPADTQAPTAPTLTNATPTATDVVLNWSGSTDNVGVELYRVIVYRVADTFVSHITTNTTANLIFSSFHAIPGEIIKVVVKAKDAAGNLSVASNEVTITVPISIPVPPTAPTNLTNQQPTTSSVMLNWTASTGNVVVKQYLVICRYPTADGTGMVSSLLNTNSTSTNFNLLFAAIQVLPGQTIKLSIIAADAAGNQSLTESNQISVLVPSNADTQAPTAPTLTNTTPTANDVVLNWSGSADNVGVTQYKVYTFITTPSGETYTTVNTTQNINFAYLGVVPGQTFKVFVKAVDAAGNLSTASNSISIIVPIVARLKINEIKLPKITKINGQPITIFANVTTSSVNPNLSYQWTIDGKDTYTQTASISYSANESSASTIAGRLIVTDPQLGKKDTLTFNFKTYRETDGITFKPYSSCDNGTGLGSIIAPNNFNVSNFPHDKYFYFKTYDSDNKLIHEVKLNPLQWANSLYNAYEVGKTYYLELKRVFDDTSFIEFKKPFVAGDGTVKYNYSLTQPEIFGNPANFMVLENAEKNVYTLYNDKISPYNILINNKAKLEPGAYLFYVLDTKTNCNTYKTIDVIAPSIASISTIKNYTWDNITQNSIQIHYTIEKLNPNLTYSYQIFDGNTPISSWKTLPSSTNGTVQLSTIAQNLLPSTTYNYKIKLRVDNYANAAMIESTTLALTTDEPIFTSNTDGLTLTVTLPKEIDINSTVTLRDIRGFLVKTYYYTGNKTFNWNVADLTSGTYFITCYINVKPVTKQIMIIR